MPKTSVKAKDSIFEARDVTFQVKVKATFSCRPQGQWHVLEDSKTAGPRLPRELLRSELTYTLTPSVDWK